MLALQLQELVKAKIIKKNINIKSTPIQTSYELTNLGRTLIPIIWSMNDWGIQYIKEVAQISDVDPSCGGGEK